MARFVAERQRRGRRGRKGRHLGDGAASDAGTWRDLKLTSRETAIIDLVLQGHSSESIGLKLNISTGTVKVHRRNVYRKLGISSQTQLLSILPQDPDLIEPTQDIRKDGIQWLVDIDGDGQFIRAWRLKRGELAVEQACRHEMAPVLRPSALRSPRGCHEGG